MKGGCLIGRLSASPCLSLSGYMAASRRAESSRRNDSLPQGRHSGPWTAYSIAAAAALCSYNVRRLPGSWRTHCATGRADFTDTNCHAFVVMPNHVHMIAAQWLGPLKGFTSHQGNQLLGTRGAFWQDESYDHLVRSNTEFEHIRAYIEQNPVTAGLASTAEQFRWSSARAA